MRLLFHGLEGERARGGGDGRIDPYIEIFRGFLQKRFYICYECEVGVRNLIFVDLSGFSDSFEGYDYCIFSKNKLSFVRC
jgi:hypothetical protein